MSKSFKKVIACMLAVLMGAFALPFSALAAQGDPPTAYNPDLDVVFGTYYDVGNGSGSLETGATGKLADNVGTASGDFDANYAALYDVPVTATRTVDQTTGALKISKLEITAAAAANYNEDCETEYSAYTYQTGDYFTATFLINNVEDIKAAQFVLNYSDNISPAGVYQYKQGKNTPKAVGSYSEGHSKTNFAWVVDGLSRLDGNSASGIYADGTDNGVGDDMCYIDCANSEIWGFINAKTTYDALCPTAAPGDPDGDDYVDFVAPDGHYGYTYPGVIVCTFAFKIVGEVSAANPIVFSPADTDDTKGAFQGGTFTADLAYTFNMVTYADAHGDAQPGAPKQFTFFGVNVNNGGGDTPHTHTWGEWEVTTPAVAATCTTAGATAVETRTCSGCSETETRGGETIAALGHDYQAVVTAPTCTEAGYTTYTCSRCQDSYTADATEALGHDLGEWAVTTAAVAATCTEAGTTAIETRSCSRCDYSETRGGETVAALGHDYQGVVTAPTCTEGGYTTYTCSRCGDSYTADATDALGHTWDAGVETTPATEEATGVMTYTCTVCGATREETIPVLPHTHIPGEAAQEDLVEATCTEPGSYNLVVRCTKCNEILSSEPKTIAALGHDFVAGETVAPTCTEAGYTVYNCSRCDATENRDEVAALGHDYQSVVTAPTCTEGGYTTYTCSRCQDTYTDDETAALGHDWSEWVVSEDASLTAEGKETRTCARCNLTEERAIETQDIVVNVVATTFGTVSGSIAAGESKTFKFGDSFTLTATPNEGYSFLGWEVNGKNVSTAKTYKAKAYANTTIEAIFSKNEADSFTVVFYDLFKNVVSTQTVSKADDLEVPTASQMARNGWTFKGWDVDPATVTAAAVITGQYEVDEVNGYTVTITGADSVATKINGEDGAVKEGIPYDSQVTVYAEGATGWKINGTVVATGDTYSFYVGTNVTVEAQFAAVEMTPAIEIVNVQLVNGSDYKYQFIATRVVPDGYKVEKAGFVFGKNLTDAELVLEKADTVSAAGTQIRVGYNNVTSVLETSLSYGVKAKEGQIKARAFMVVSKNGKSEIIYSAVQGHAYTAIDPIDADD